MESMLVIIKVLKVTSTYIHKWCQLSLIVFATADNLRWILDCQLLPRQKRQFGSFWSVSALYVYFEVLHIKGYQKVSGQLFLYLAKFPFVNFPFSQFLFCQTADAVEVYKVGSLQSGKFTKWVDYKVGRLQSGKLTS